MYLDTTGRRVLFPYRQTKAYFRHNQEKRLVSTFSVGSVSTSNFDLVHTIFLTFTHPPLYIPHFFKWTQPRIHKQPAYYNIDT